MTFISQFLYFRIIREFLNLQMSILVVYKAYWQEFGTRETIDSQILAKIKLSQTLQN